MIVDQINHPFAPGLLSGGECIMVFSSVVGKRLLDLFGAANAARGYQLGIGVTQFSPGARPL